MTERLSISTETVSPRAVVNMGKSMKRILISIGITIGLAIIGIIVFTSYHTCLEQKLGPEPFKLIYQFFLIVVIGGAVSLLFSRFTKMQEDQSKERERGRVQENEKRDLQRKFRGDFIEAYNSAKKIRRLLRAKARAKSNVNGQDIVMVKPQPYHRQMQTLIDVQLRFETLKEEAESRLDLFSGVVELKEVVQELGRIESYLNDIVGEYEDSYESLQNADLQPISQFKKLKELIGPYKEAKDFKEELKEPAKRIVKGLLKLLDKAESGTEGFV